MENGLLVALISIIQIISEITFLIPWIIALIVLFILKNSKHNKTSQRMGYFHIESFIILTALILSIAKLPPYSFMDTFFLFAFVLSVNLLIIILTTLALLFHGYKKIHIKNLLQNAYSDPRIISFYVVNSVFLIISNSSIWRIHLFILFLLTTFFAIIEIVLGKNKQNITKLNIKYYIHLLVFSFIFVNLFIVTGISQIFSEPIKRGGNVIFDWLINSGISCYKATNDTVKIEFYNPFISYPCKIGLYSGNVMIHEIIVPPREYTLKNLNITPYTVDNKNYKIQVECYTGIYNITCK